MINDLNFTVGVFRLKKVSQEVGYITTKEGSLDFSKYPVGSILYLLPWHVSHLFADGQELLF